MATPFQPIPVPSPKTISSLTFGEGGSSLTASTGGVPLAMTINMAAGSLPEETVQVDLSSDQPGVVIVPASLRFSGLTDSLMLTTERVFVDTPVVVTAQYGSSQVNAAIVITREELPIPIPPIPERVWSLQFGVDGPLSDWVGGSPLSLKISMLGGTEGATVQVDLSSDQPAVVIVPASVTFAGPVYVGQLETTTVQDNTPVVVTAGYTFSQAQATITIQPPFLQWVKFNPASVTGGAVSQGTVKVSAGGAPPENMDISLISSNPGVAHVPQFVTVAARIETGIFPVTTNPVADSTEVTITAYWPNVDAVSGPVKGQLTVSAGAVPNLILVVTLYDEIGDPIATPIPGQAYTMSINVQNDGSGAAAASTLIVEETANGTIINSWQLTIPKILPGTGTLVSISPAAFDSDVGYDFNFYDPPGTNLTTVSYNL